MTFLLPKLGGNWISSSILAHCWQWLKAALQWSYYYYAALFHACQICFQALFCTGLPLTVFYVIRETEEGKKRVCFKDMKNSYENINAIMREAWQIRIKPRFAERSACSRLRMVVLFQITPWMFQTPFWSIWWEQSFAFVPSESQLP